LRSDETCRMLKSRVERFESAEDRGLLNGREQAMAFVKALPVEPRQRVEPILWANSQTAGVYTLEAAFQVAERIELVQTYAAGMQGWADQGRSSATQRGVAMQAAEEDDRLCFSCGEARHQAASCKGLVGRLAK
jgi:NADH pyrophosphatase NudC (nudix superfamily)